MIIDFHLHPLLSVLSEEEFLSEVERSGIDVGVLLAIDVDDSVLADERFRGEIFEKLVNCDVWDVRVVDRIAEILRLAKIGNDVVASLARRYPNKFVAVGSVNVSKGDKYVERKLVELSNPEFKGVKLLPTLQFFDPEKKPKPLIKLLKHCERHGRFVVFHTGCDPAVWEVPEFSECANPRKLIPIAKQFRDLPIVLAHMGSYSSRHPGIWLDEALELGARFDNVWFDIAAVTYLTTRSEFVDKIRASVGFDRVLFGSDYPVVLAAGITDLLDEVRLSLLSEREKRAVLGDNAKKLLETAG